MGRGSKKNRRNETTSCAVSKKEKWDWQEIIQDALNIGLSHEEFWRITPVELRQRIEAYWWQVDQQRQFLSHLAAAIMQPHTKKRIKGKDLYKPISFKRKDALSNKERLKRFEQTAKRLAPDATLVTKLEERS
jgi:hypothetical protein